MASVRDSLTIAPENRDKVLIHVHGSCYVLFPGQAGTNQEAVMPPSQQQLGIAGMRLAVNGS